MIIFFPKTYSNSFAIRARNPVISKSHHRNRYTKIQRKNVSLLVFSESISPGANFPCFTYIHLAIALAGIKTNMTNRNTPIITITSIVNPFYSQVTEPSVTKDAPWFLIVKVIFPEMVSIGLTSFVIIG